MPSLDNTLLGTINKSTPLISIEAILDLDMAVIKYAILELRNPKYFDLDKVSDMSYIQLLGEIYRRKYDNPLEFLSISNSNKEILNECYKELREEHEDELLKLAPSTAMFDLLNSFVSSGDIKPTILCYNNIEKEFLENNKEQLLGVNISTYDEIIHSSHGFNIYSQIYLRYWEKEIEKFKGIIKSRTFYISTSGVNLTDNNDDLKNNDLVVELIKKNNKISLFDMYRMDIIGGYSHGIE